MADTVGVQACVDEVHKSLLCAGWFWLKFIGASSDRVVITCTLTMTGTACRT
jgi:hypothetical protein